LTVALLAACDGTSGRTGTSQTSGSNTGSTTAGTTGSTTSGTTTSGTTGSSTGGTTGSTDPCVNDPKACYTVYAHGDHTLYKIDLMAKTLNTIGPFKAPLVKVGTSMVEDTITDLAVDPNNVIYVVSKTTLYTADPNDGHVTTVGTIAACGTSAVAMTFDNNGNLYVGDHQGAFCKVDPANPSNVTKLTLSNSFALSGDLVAIGDGTMFGSATILDATGKPTAATAANNLLIKIDPTTANVTQIGSIGSKNLFGLAYAAGQVFGFTHDCSGDVVVIDPKTGVGTQYNVFPDPMPNCKETGNNGTGINFAGAGVNSTVEPVPVS
jgi:hypothetical protein